MQVSDQLRSVSNTCYSTVRPCINQHVSLVALLNTVGRADVAAIASLNALFRSAGQVIGLAMSSAVQQVMLERELHKNLVGPDAALVRDRLY
jgi:hypothetical protein